MTTFDLASMLEAAPIEPCAPVPLRLLDQGAWALLAVGEPSLDLIGMFVADGRVHALFDAAGGLLFAATSLIDQRYPALSPGWPAAAWFERREFDLTGAVAIGAVDQRPAITHATGDAGWPRFIETAGEGLYQIGLGPVAGSIATPLHRRFTMDGARIARLEHRFGYAHRDVAGLMCGTSPRAAARFAARLAGDATVVHALAFARAVEAACGAAIPPRAEALRIVMLAIERVTAGLCTLSATVEIAGHVRQAATLGHARDTLAEAVDAAFGHRLMMDLVTPGGLVADVRFEALPALGPALSQAATMVRRVGSASLRRNLRRAGDVVRHHARAAIASAEAAIASLATLPDGTIGHTLPTVDGMGLGMAESMRGRVYHWVRLSGGQVGGVAMIDPSARLIPMLETQAMGMDLDDFALISACYALSASAIDG